VETSSKCLKTNALYGKYITPCSWVYHSLLP